MITILESTNLQPQNPELKKIADDIVKRVELAAEKVALNHAQPHEFPIASGSSIENVLKPMFDGLREDQKSAAVIRAKARISAPTENRARRLASLTNIDLRRSSFVEEQVNALNRRTLVTLTSAAFDSELTANIRPYITNVITPGIVKASTLIPHHEEIDLADPDNAPKLKSISSLIKNKHKAMGGDTGVLGKQTQWNGWWARYEYGGIFYNSVDAFEVHGAIWSKFRELSGTQGILGLPKTDEKTTPDGIGRYNHFQGGSIYWTPETGVHAVHGAIRDKWADLGWEKSPLGYPTTDELTPPDGVGRFNHFQHGSIYWSPKTGAHAIYGAIHSLWKSLGWEQSSLGYPTSDEVTFPPNSNGQANTFQGGWIRWTPESGAYLASIFSYSHLTLRCVKLHCLDETDPEFAGGDEMRMGGTFVEISPAGDKSSKFGLVDLEDNWDDGNWNLWTSPRHLVLANLQENEGWPKSFIATCILVEKDSGKYSDTLNELLEKIRPIVKEEVKQAATTAGVQFGGPLIGYIAGKLAAYIMDKALTYISDLWNDNPFKPVTMLIQIPGPGALFANGFTQSEETHWVVSGWGGKYEFWLDWALLLK